MSSCPLVTETHGIKSHAQHPHLVQHHCTCDQKNMFGYNTLKELKELIIAWWGSEPSDGEEEYRQDDYDRS